MKLVIVESPTKAKTITKFLGQEYIVKASMGHVMDLPKSKLGIDVENNFTPQYELVKDRKDILTELQKYASSADSIILATDPDREGEAIAAHIKDVLSKKTKNSAKSQEKSMFARIVFHEITKQAIQDALEHPRSIDQNLVNAQTARRILDRLVGYKLSPILWQKVRRGLSAGRVQSVALRLMVEREREIEKFTKQEYWTILLMVSKQKQSNTKVSKIRKNETEATVGAVSGRGDKKGTEFELVEINGEKIESNQVYKLYDGNYKTTKTAIISKEQADNIVSSLKEKEYIVEDILKKQTKRSPQPPYTTSTLQQDASRRLGLSGKRTMGLAQKLYEEGFITYHRTDSVHLAESAVAKMQAFIKKEYGSSYSPSSPRIFTGKQKNAQEAHEAIRPTDVSLFSNIVNEKLGAQYSKLYELIWRRAVASQMSDAQVESTTVFVKTSASIEKNETAQGNVNTEYTNATFLFKTAGSVLIFDGFLKVNPFGLQDKKLPAYEAKEILKYVDAQALEHETPPPPRYNDASLVSSLEEEGIGRPSTYASIISVIETRRYIERQQGKFIPTSIGTAVNDFLVKYFSDIDDIPFTAKIEDQFDEIAKGEKQWVPMMEEFYQPLEKKLESIGNAERVKIEVEETNELCPKDGAPLVIREGKYGKFLSCKNFPTCNFKKSYVQDMNIACPKDGDVNHVPEGTKEPGRIIAKRTKKGRTFYGCSNYPACTFAVWKLQEIQKQEEKKESSD